MTIPPGARLILAKDRTKRHPCLIKGTLGTFTKEGRVHADCGHLMYMEDGYQPICADEMEELNVRARKVR